MRSKGKRWWLALFVAVMVLGLVGCGQSQAPPAAKPAPAPAQPQATPAAPAPAQPQAKPATPAPAPAPAPKTFDAAAHFKGKTVTLIVPWAAATGMDRYARILQPFLEKTIPGNPKIVIENKPGAGAVVGLNYFWKASKPDGLWLLIDAGPAMKQALAKYTEAEIKMEELPAVGAYADNQTVHANPGAIKTVKDVFRRDKRTFVALRGSGSPGAISMLSELAGMELKNIKGVVYPGGSSEVRAKLLAGEVDMFNEGVQTYERIVRQDVAKGQMAALWQSGLYLDGKFARHPQQPDIPLYAEVYQQVKGTPLAGLDLQAAQFSSKQLASLATWITGRGTPPEIVQVLRDAWWQAVNNPDFVKTTVINGQPVPRIKGEVTHLYNLDIVKMPASLIDRHFGLWKASGLD